MTSAQETDTKTHTASQDTNNINDQQMQTESFNTEINKLETLVKHVTVNDSKQE